MKFIKRAVPLLALLATSISITTDSIMAQETRLRRPTVLYGSAKMHGKASSKTTVNPNVSEGDSDSVIKGSADVNTLFPTVEKPNLMPLSAQKDNNINRPLTGKLNQQELSILAKRDLIVFVDKSYSMNTRDCPPVIGGVPVRDRSPGFLAKRDGASRWRWVAAHTLDLANQVAPYNKDGFKLILFNDWKQEFSNVTPDKIPPIFMSTQVGGSENIVLFLAEQLNHYMKIKKANPSTKPLAVAVLTDGLPDDRKNFPDVIRSITQQMDSPQDIKIVFIQVGKSAEGGEFLEFLDNSLTSLGAKYDIIDHKSFHQAEVSGVGRAIVDAILE